MSSRTITRIDIDRREASRKPTIHKCRKRIDRIKLVALVREQRAAKERVEKVFAAQRYRQRLIRLARQQRSVLSVCILCRHVTHVLSRATREEAVRDAKLNLVCVGNRIGVIEANDAIEVVDAGQLSISHVRLDHVTKEEVPTATKVSRKRRRPHVQFKLSVRPRQVTTQNITRVGIE